MYSGQKMLSLSDIMVENNLQLLPVHWILVKSFP